MRFRIKLFADGANLDRIRSFVGDPRVAGFTTNPTLMRKAGIVDYRAFAEEAISLVSPRPISFEVFSDHPDEMVRQAQRIASWGENVYVKIPVSTTTGRSTVDVIEELSSAGVRVNVTAVMTLGQIREVAGALSANTPSVISVFAGRIADAGVDPIPIIENAKQILELHPQAELLWASPREIFNLIQAEQSGADIITMTSDLWAKLENIGKPLDLFSLETVQMFYDDARGAGYAI